MLDINIYSRLEMYILVVHTMLQWLGNKMFYLTFLHYSYCTMKCL